MSVGCLVVASRTPPVEEIISDGENGYLFDFFDVDGLADRVGEVLKQAEAHRHISANARASVVARYDLKGICLPAYLSLLQQLTGKRMPGAAAPTPGR
jgi:glycosyltransferase involved in cell wall biosynthesis